MTQGAITDKLQLARQNQIETYNDVLRELKKLRKVYSPYLRSLPKEIRSSKQIPIDKGWKFTFEWVEEKEWEKKSVPQIEAPSWDKESFDDSAWDKTTVPEWRVVDDRKDGIAQFSSFIAWYRTRFQAALPEKGKRVFLIFEGVDWKAEVWLNGKLLGQHKGYFEPFRFDVTNILKDDNVLAVRVLSGPVFGKPLAYTTVLPSPLDYFKDARYTRDKSESLAGNYGHSQCNITNGGGILREVHLEYTGESKISEIFVRGNIEDKSVNVKVEFDSILKQSLTLVVEILPENFKGKGVKKSILHNLPKGKSLYKTAISLPQQKLWSPDTPYLYRCRIILQKGKRIIDTKYVLFGQRSFRMDGSNKDNTKVIPGTFYLNGKPIFLRGTNDEALNLWYYWNENDKLINSILMLKIANFNAIRSVQHVNFKEVREYLDRLGIMSQQDVGFGKGGSESELVETAVPIARECYNNPGVIMFSFANETTVCLSTIKRIVDNVLSVDPERVINPVSDKNESQYPAERRCSSLLVDTFHTYLGWYDFPGEKIWELSKIWKYWRLRITRSVKKRYLVAEYGGEALDSFESMKACYSPHKWVPDSPRTKEIVGNKQVKKADYKQVIGLGKKPTNLGEYIEASQNYQAMIIAELTSEWRISVEKISGYFQYFFADPLPAYWPKAIVSPDLRPKKAYYELLKLNKPLVSLFKVTDDGKSLSLWIANDFPYSIKGCCLSWEVSLRRKPVLSGKKSLDIAPSSATFATVVEVSGIKEEKEPIRILLVLKNSNGSILSSYGREVCLGLWRKRHCRK